MLFFIRFICCLCVVFVGGGQEREKSGPLKAASSSSGGGSSNGTDCDTILGEPIQYFGGIQSAGTKLMSKLTHFLLN